MTAALSWAGRVIGMLASAACCLLWVIIIWFPSGGLIVRWWSLPLAALRGLMALVAGIASFQGHAIVIFVIFVASFLPVGAYLLGIDHWLRFVGMLNVTMLAAALLIGIANRIQRKSK
jgi:hypothetical protein